MITVVVVWFFFACLIGWFGLVLVLVGSASSVFIYFLHFVFIRKTFCTVNFSNEMVTFLYFTLLLAGKKKHGW